MKARCCTLNCPKSHVWMATSLPGGNVRLSLMVISVTSEFVMWLSECDKCIKAPWGVVDLKGTTWMQVHLPFNIFYTVVRLNNSPLCNLQATFLPSVGWDDGNLCGQMLLQWRMGSYALTSNSDTKTQINFVYDLFHSSNLPCIKKKKTLATF